MSIPKLRCNWLLIALGAVLLGGCATGNVEDDEFYNRGWVWPRELDEPPQRTRVVDDAVPLEQQN